MKNKYGIGFFAAAIILMLVLTGAYQLTYYKARERAALENEETREEEKASAAETPDEAVAAKGEALKEDAYYLMEVNGYVVVYLSDKETPFEYTDIPYDELPALLREEIRNGKYIESTEELYGFLENYSS